MKNVKLNSLKAGFSLIEMLVVIAIIGIIAAIAIPNIGSINKNAAEATALRNAQSVASILNAAAAAGVDLSAALTTATLGTGGQDLIDLAELGVIPTSGAFDGNKFTTGDIDDKQEADSAQYLSLDATNNAVVYAGTTDAVSSSS